jgi:hypothetical protein
MTDIERKADEAKRLIEGVQPYLDQIERDAFEAIVHAASQADVLDHRLLVVAIRKFRGALQSAVTAGQQAARKAPSVA